VSGPILWLRADLDLECQPYSDGKQRVTVWHDQSGHQNDAVARTGKPGPLCGSDAFPLNGVVDPYFADDNSDFASLILDVDLTPLLGSDYTIFVVERRRGDKYENYVIGTLIPTPDNFDCSATGPNPYRGLHFGYRLDDTYTLEEFCDGLRVTVPVLTGTPVPHVDVGWFSQAPDAGQQIFVDGVFLGADHSQNKPLQLATGGAIGRGYEETYDERFIGDIAEVVVYPSALSDADRNAVEAELRQRWGF